VTDITQADIQAYTDYVQAAGRRAEILSVQHVRGVLDNLDRKLARPASKAISDKTKYYKAERKRLEGVLRVMEARDG